ncbi:MAG: acyl-CoA thioester hydrolase [Ignavibacteria bacterium]|nr:MAG: acyl-CoA thioester hydrolase [Ignavibacteria bacterium]KAF0161525.1 MAG: acyl-CoA thioester hydrolase [Ignavibacteria bacterium]
MQQELKLEKSNFKHTIIEAVRFHEVDMMSVCNNAVYFNYFEDARIKYIQDLIKNYSLKNILAGHSYFIMAHNEADYIEPALLEDELIVYTRVNFIKSSSFGFRHLIEKKSTGKIITKGGGVFVHIDKKTRTPVPLPQEFYEAVKDFEHEVEIINRKKSE